MIEIIPLINVIPYELINIKIFIAVAVKDTNGNTTAYTAGTISNIELLYGNAAINGSVVSPREVTNIGLGITFDYNGDAYYTPFYFKSLPAVVMPNNIQRITQKLPHGVFKNTSSVSIIGQIVASIADMANDYYNDYFAITKSIYPSVYTEELEYEFNGTFGLWRNSTYPEQLFKLLNTLDVVYLNSYDLELFVSKYIYYRIGESCPVYIEDWVKPITDFWVLNSPILSILNSTTILASSSDVQQLKNLEWTIYNSNSFAAEFKDEVTNLIIRISRADIGNLVTYSPVVDPVDDGFELIGPTYPLDSRIIYKKCLQYLNDDAFPLNVIGYVKL